MKPLYITLKNYKRYGDYETTLDLSQDSVQLIVGKTGSGKTSFVDAIIWCLYGKSTCNVDDVVNRQSGKDCKVEFGFTINNDEFCITRYRKHKDFGNDVLLFKNKKNITPTKKIEVQNLIEEITGITKQALISSVIFSSEIYISFMRSKGLSDRIKIFENILNLKEINKWAEEIKKLKKPIEDRYNKIKETINKVDYGISSIEDNINDYKITSKNKLIEFKNQKELLKENIEKYKKEIKQLQEVDINFEIEKTKLYKENKEKNEIIENEIKEIEIIDIESEVLKLNNIKNKIEENEEILNNNDINKIEENNKNKEKCSKLELELNSLKEEDLSKLKKEFLKIEKDLEQLKENKCPTCFQKLPDDNNLKEKYINELKEIKKEIEEKEENNNKIKKEKERIQKEIDDLNIKKFNYTIEELNNINYKLKTDKERKNELEENIINTEKLNKTNIERINKLKEQKIEINEIPKYEIEYLEKLNEQINNINENIIDNENEIKTIDNKASSIYDKNYIKGLEEKIKKLEIEKKKNITMKSNKEKELIHYEYLLKLFSNKGMGIKKDIIGRMINVFNSKVNYFLPIFFADEKEIIKIEFDNSLNDIITVDNEEVNFDTFSSGEKTRMELAVAFSLFALVKMFFSSSASFVVFDEILDGNLDENSLDKVLGVVEEYGKTNTVLVISHRKELMDKFSNHIEISKDKNGFSKVNE